MWRQVQTLGDQLRDGLQGNESREANSHAQALPAATLVA
jgi:hypothetical protein